jgi:hypothetical protein
VLEILRANGALRMTTVLNGGSGLGMRGWRRDVVVMLVAGVPPLRGPTRKKGATEKSGRSGRDDRGRKERPVSEGGPYNWIIC